MKFCFGEMKDLQLVDLSKAVAFIFDLVVSAS